MTPYKACSCRDPDTGRLLGNGCPEIKIWERNKDGTAKLDRAGNPRWRWNPNHGKWYARYEAPPKADGKRRRPRVGPCDTEREVREELTKVLGQETGTGYNTDRKMKFGAYLNRWHEWRVSEGELADSTLEAEREAIELYLKPGLGHVPLVDLRDHHFRDLYVAMRKINRRGENAKDSDLLRRLLEARASQEGRRISTRPLSESRIKRIHAVGTAALNMAVNHDHILPFNPAAGIFKSTGSKKKGRIKPLPWTEERVEHWLETGQIPGKVMVWTTHQCGTYLDFIEAAGERLYALYHVDAYYGPRRGEVVGLERPDLSIKRRRLHIRQAQVDDELDDPKSESSDRQLILDKETARVLQAWSKRQLEERLAWGDAYQDSGRVFTYEDGRALRPGYISERFNQHLTQYAAIRCRYYDEGWSVARIARRHRISEQAVRVAVEGGPLPPIRFHDLRHGAATMLRAAHVPIKAISDMLGHASTSFTDDVYTAVAEELAEQAASAIMAFVPRRNRRDDSSIVRTINGPSGGQNDLNQE
ncbi:MAG: tyrosine-type recombinase/integrase [Streptosporangiales bacterium]|nr:tyrosine-type recombinase/integrase [Streptosporangiales bacterium]